MEEYKVLGGHRAGRGLGSMLNSGRKVVSNGHSKGLGVRTPASPMVSILMGDRV